MKCFSWSHGTVTEGFALTSDERLGQVLFLGEEGRGRRYEKIAISRHRPAVVREGRVYDAHASKIVLPAKDGKPEKAFYVLEQERAGEAGVLVRVNTHTSYIRNGRGCWRVIAGKPEVLVSGFGAFGDAGRIGNWDDGLLVVRIGDVLRVYPSRGEHSYALWLDDAGRPTTVTWQDYQNLQAVAQAETVLAEAATKPEALNLLFGQMPAYSFHAGNITRGLQVTDGATGKVVAFGEKGRGRVHVEVPLVGIDTATRSDQYGRPIEVVESASVVKLGEKIVGLTKVEKVEDAYLVRVSTSCGYSRRGSGKWDAWKGSPTTLVHAYGADGDAGGIGGWDDDLVVLRPGDVLYVRPSGDGPRYALFVESGEVRSEEWTAWKVKDAKSDPAFYVAKGTAPWGHTPAEWIGSIVAVMVLGERTMVGNRLTPTFEESQIGELIAVSLGRLVLNLGWDGRDRHDVPVMSGLFVALQKDKQARQPQGEEADKRRALRGRAEELKGLAVAAMAQSYFGLTESCLRTEVDALAREQGFDTMPTEGWFDSLNAWVEKAQNVLSRFTTVEAELKSLETRQGAGEVRVDFGGHFRVMGATNQAEYWVVRPDGTLRDPDEIAYRKRYTSEGNKQWRLVGPEELATSWFKGCTAAPHEFVVVKLPVGGCTAEQITTAERLEREIAERFEGAVGISGDGSPSVGFGWGLGQKPAPTSPPAAPTELATPASAEQVVDALAALRAKFGKK